MTGTVRRGYWRRIYWVRINLCFYSWVTLFKTWSTSLFSSHAAHTNTIKESIKVCLRQIVSSLTSSVLLFIPILTFSHHFCLRLCFSIHLASNFHLLVLRFNPFLIPPYWKKRVSQDVFLNVLVTGKLRVTYITRRHYRLAENVHYFCASCGKNEKVSFWKLCYLSWKHQFSIMSPKKTNKKKNSAYVNWTQCCYYYYSYKMSQSDALGCGLRAKLTMNISL